MSIVGLFIALLIIVLVAYVVNKVIEVDATIKMVANVILLVVVILWFLSAFGIVHVSSLGTIR